MSDPVDNPRPAKPSRPLSRRAKWVAILGGGVLLLLCLVILAEVVVFRQQLPIISSYFPTSTPIWKNYSNPAAGLNLSYPPRWVWTEFGDASSGFGLILTSNEELLFSAYDFPQKGVMVEVFIGTMRASDFPFTIAAGSMADLVDYLALDMSLTRRQASQNLQIGGFPAATGEYSLVTSPGETGVVSITAILRAGEIILIRSESPDSEWASFQPQVGQIVNSITLSLP